MKFNHEAVEGGLEIKTNIENGKAFLEFAFLFTEEGSQDTRCQVRLQIMDCKGQLVLQCNYPLWEEEPACGRLMHPQLWRGMENPCLYFAKAYLIGEGGEVLDTLEKSFPLRTLEYIAGKGWFLNHVPYEMRVVEYDYFIKRREVLRENLEILRRMGANTIYTKEKSIPAEMREMCDELGFLLWSGECLLARVKEDIRLPGEELYRLSENLPNWEGLLTQDGFFLKDSYYYYKALWSKEPFVYIGREGMVKPQKGVLNVKVYSNHKKVALYVDGILFAFQSGEGECLFEEIPIEGYPLVLTAEAGECGMSVTIFESEQV